MKPFRVGVVGCGRIADVHFASLQILQQEGTVQVCAAMDKEKTRAEGFAAKFPNCMATDDFSVFLKAELDAVHILTPHFLHCEQTIACLQRGFHVLCEKPIAIHPADADRMMAAEQASGKQLGVIYQNRYITGIQRARRLVKSGALGKPTGAWSSLNWWRPPSYYECDWKGSWDKEGGGVVIDQAIHSIDLVRYLMDCEAVSVKAGIDRRVLTNIEVEDVASAAITFENGAVYAFSACNYYTQNDPIQIEVSFERGCVHLTEDEVEIRFSHGQEEVVAMETVAGRGGESYWGLCHELQIQDFYRCLSAGTAVPFSPADAKKTLMIVQAIYHAAATGKACSIPDEVPVYGRCYLPAPG